MILRTRGAEYAHDGVVYTIGATIMATAGSPYAGLFGTIVEIQDGADRETENKSPDIYCSFDKPVIPAVVEKLEKTFSNLYAEPKRLREIPLSCVIMAPEMIHLLRDKSAPPLQTDVWALYEDWANDGKFGSSLQLFSAYEEACCTMMTMLRDELESGYLMDMQSSSQFSVMSAEDYYEAWIDGEYNLSHYRLALEKIPLNLTNSFIEKLASAVQR